MNPKAIGDFTIVMNSIATACKIISSKVNHAGLVDLYGLSGQQNVSQD